MGGWDGGNGGVQTVPQKIRLYVLSKMQSVTHICKF